MNTMKNKPTRKQLEFELMQWKKIDAAHQARRAEMMYLIYEYGASMPEIAKKYGCKRQYVQQEIKRHLEQQATTNQG